MERQHRMHDNHLTGVHRLLAGKPGVARVTLRVKIKLFSPRQGQNFPGGSFFDIFPEKS